MYIHLTEALPCEQVDMLSAPNISHSSKHFHYLLGRSGGGDDDKFTYRPPNKILFYQDNF